MAFTVLDAIPSLLTKRPPKIRPILKYLYGQISLKKLSLSQEDELLFSSTHSHSHSNVRIHSQFVL